MATFNGIDQYMQVTNGPSGVNYWVYLTLSSDYPSFTGTNRYIHDGRLGGGTSYFLSQANSDNTSRLDLQDTRVNGSNQSVLNPTTCPSGSVISYRPTDSATNTGIFNLCARHTAEDFLAISIDLVEIYANDNTTLLHRFDITNPTSENIVDSVGSANLTLYGFTFNQPASTTSDVIPPANNSFVDITSLAASGDRITAIPDLAIGDQLRYESILYQGATPTGHTVVVNADGTYTLTGAGDNPIPDGTYNFEVRAWDTSDQTWGTAADQTVVIDSGEVISVGFAKPMVKDLLNSLVRNLLN